MFPGRGAAAPGRLSASTSWFHDPLSATQRAALVPVPAHPRSVHGAARRTQALWKSHGGAFAVPATTAVGHQLQQGQAVTLSRRNLFHAGSAEPTMATRHRLVTLAASLDQVTAVTCEGYTDFGGDAAREARLARKRAAKVCSLLSAAQPGLGTTTRGFGRTVPVVVGGKASQRAANRRVVVLATAQRAVTPPSNGDPVVTPQATAPEAPALTSATGGTNAVTLGFTAPADDGGSPITGYEWSTDQTTWHPLTTTGSSPYTVQLGSLLAGTQTYYVRAVNAIGDGPASSGVTGTVTDPVPTAPDAVFSPISCSGVTANFSQVNANIPASANSVSTTGLEYSLDGGTTWVTAPAPQLIAGFQWRFSLVSTDADSVCASRTPTFLVRFASANGPSADTTETWTFF